MLAVLRDRGWDVIGTERSDEETIVATETTGIPILKGGLDRLVSSSFDLVILFQVLEHMDDPAATLRRCSELLKPGGSLVVSVPNASSWQARAFARWWFHLDVPRHQHHFSTQALERALLNAQLRVMRKRFVSLEHDPFGLLQSALNWLGFRQNLLTRLLMGMSENDVSPFMLCAMCLTASALVVPSVLASICTWMLGSGASQEMWAQKA